jgi:heptosyltransferase-1
VRIAIVKLSAMGDIVHAMVTLQYMKQAYPDMTIDWIVERSFVDVLKHNPHIDTILPLELKSIKKQKMRLFSQIRLVRTYAKNNYDLVIDAQGLLKSAIVTRLLGKRRAGFSKTSIREGVASLFYTEHVTIPYHANTIDRNAKVLTAPLNIEVSSEMIHAKERFLNYKETRTLTPYLASKKPNVLFVIGSTWESRNYPKEHFATVAKGLDANVLVVWGNDEEQTKATWIATQTSNVTVMPQLSLNDLKMLIDKVDLLIGNDTGPTHMAWGLNRPSITLFGPTPTNRVYETTLNKVLKSRSKVNHYKLNKNDFSIQEISPQSVITLAKELLDA